MSGFSNPVANAAGTLIRTVMKSINFLTGVSGWAIFKNGNAEFNGGTFRGDVVVGGAIQRITIGTTLPADLVAYYAAKGYPAIAGIINYTDATHYWYDVNLTPNGATHYHAYGWSAGGVVNETWRPQIIGTNLPVTAWGFDVAGVYTFGSNARSNSPQEHVTFNQSCTLEMNGPMQFDGKEAPRGFLGANVTLLGTVLAGVGFGAEAAVPAVNWQQQPTMTFITGGMFRVTLTGGVYDSASVLSQCIVRVRRGAASVVLAQMCSFRQTVPGGIGGSVPTVSYTGFFKNTGATVATQMGLTLNTILGATTYNAYGDANIPLIMAFEYIGSVGSQPELAAGCPSIN